MWKPTMTIIFFTLALNIVLRLIAWLFRLNRFTRAEEKAWAGPELKWAGLTQIMAGLLDLLVLAGLLWLGPDRSTQQLLAWPRVLLLAPVIMIFFLLPWTSLRHGVPDWPLRLGLSQGLIGGLTLAGWIGISFLVDRRTW
jgi:hypothetical protein